MRMHFRLSLLAAAAAFASGLSGALVPQAEAADLTIKLGWTTVDGPQDPYAVGARAFKERVEAASNGRLDVQLYPNRSSATKSRWSKACGSAPSMPASSPTPCWHRSSRRCSSTTCRSCLPMRSRHARFSTARSARSSAPTSRSKGVKLLAWMEGGFRNMINNVRPVTKPDDVSGVKFRVMQNPVYISMFSSLGGNAVPMAWGETFTAVQQGAIDGLEIPLAIIDQAKYYEVTKYPLDHQPHLFRDRARDVEAHLRPHARRHQEGHHRSAAPPRPRHSAKRRGRRRTKLAPLEKSGMKVNRITDVKPFRASVQSVYEKFKDSIGPDLLKETLASVQ